MSAGAVAVPARRERVRTATSSRWLDLSFLLVILVMTAHATSANDGRRTTTGFGIQSHYWAKATLEGNRLDGNAQPTGTFLHARLVHAD